MASSPISRAVEDLVGLLHAQLKTIQDCEQFVTNAEQEGDQELAAYFREIQDGDREEAEKARAMLAARLSR
jgi:hypothetical protein